MDMMSACDVLSSSSSSVIVINGGGEQLSAEEENSISQLLLCNHSITLELPSLSVTSLLPVAAAAATVAAAAATVATVATACQQIDSHCDYFQVCHRVIYILSRLAFPNGHHDLGPPQHVQCCIPLCICLHVHVIVSRVSQHLDSLGIK